MLVEKAVKIQDDAEARLLFGKHDETLKELEKNFGVRTVFRGGEVKIAASSEKSVDEVKKILEDLLAVIRSGNRLSERDMDYSTKKEPKTFRINDIFLDKIEVGSKRAHITPKSEGQKHYIEAIRKNHVVFCIGPAGTGKTYLAVAMAVNALKKNLASRIILTRPAVEAGESLGFLPGDMYAKVNPYLRPLYDALHDMVDPKLIKEYLDSGVIEVAPLAYMRGRTLNDSFIIMDEAQNSTPEQMKMFLTRIGFDSKAVVTGDITQSDLPKNRMSGLAHAWSVLTGTKGLDFVTLKSADVIRHEVVQRIIESYRKAETRKRKKHE